MEFNSLMSVAKHFANKDTCIEHLAQLRWRGHVKCVFCGKDKIYTLKGATKRYKCAHPDCRKQFSVIKGTIFENSPIPLTKWFMAIYLMTAHKKGISSYQLAQDLEVTQKSAWFMLHRIRFIFNSGSFEHQPGAMIEMDETYIGGKAQNRHGYRQSIGLKVSSGKPRTADKMAVFGMLERGGNVMAVKVPDAKSTTLMPYIQNNINTTATIITDESTAYYNVAKSGYAHERVNHTKGGFVRGVFHTNSIEGFWSQLKRGIFGIYHQVSYKHLDQYIGEFQFRYNGRELTQHQRFENMLSLADKRLTYQELIQDAPLAKLETPTNHKNDVFRSAREDNQSTEGNS